MRIFLVTMCLLAIVLTACETTSAPISESGDSTTRTQVEESAPPLLLSEESAMSILQTYLQECVLDWDRAYQRQVAAREETVAFREILNRTPPPTIAPPPSQAERKLLLDLATRTNSDIVWSAQYHGVTEVPDGINYYRRTAVETETWVVIGPGFEMAGSDLEVVPGRWKVYAGGREAFYLDAPARLAIQEYNIYSACP